LCVSKKFFFRMPEILFYGTPLPHPVAASLRTPLRQPLLIFLRFDRRDCHSHRLAEQYPRFHRRNRLEVNGARNRVC
jgi:hypothetical protein